MKTILKDAIVVLLAALSIYLIFVANVAYHSYDGWLLFVSTIGYLSSFFGAMYVANK